jgi:hypothetical protein
MTIDDFKRPNAHHLIYPILSRNPVNFDNSLLFRKPPRTYISKVQSVPESRNRYVFLETNVAMRTRAAPRRDACSRPAGNRSTAEVWWRQGGSDPLAERVHATNPLGETFRWVMKAYLQRDYSGVHEKRVVQEKVKESCQDRLRLIRLVPGRLARKVTIAAIEAEGRPK